MIPSDLGLIVGLIMLVTGRFISVRALPLLPPANKSQVVQRLARVSTWQLLPLVVVIVGFFIGARVFRGDPVVLQWVFLLVVVGLIVSGQVMTSRALQGLDLPPGFRKQHLISRGFSLAAFILLILVLVPGRA
jgi:hypothetical protein